MMLVTAALAAAACRAPEPQEPAMAGHPMAAPQQSDVRLPREIEAQIDELREITKPYRKFTGAEQAGWSTPVPGCFDNQPIGAMGYHYLNGARLDATVDRRQPEILVYEPLGDGQLRLVAVEYAVPFAAWTSSTPPSLYGQSFHRNEAFELWVLHVWHEKPNRNGIFQDWNPSVKCR
jgi:hypothetical protein